MKRAFAHFRTDSKGALQDYQRKRIESAGVLARGLAYGDGPRQKLDVYKPRHAAKAPVVVYFYGGS
jgi:acetyl esterase/lipase